MACQVLVTSRGSAVINQTLARLTSFPASLAENAAGRLCRPAQALRIVPRLSKPYSVVGLEGRGTVIGHSTKSVVEPQKQLPGGYFA